jgi:hypothetical protein
MGGIKRVGDLGGEAECFVEWDLPLLEAVGERVTLQLLHDQEVDRPFLAHVVEGADVGVGELGDRLRLAFEALQSAGVTSHGLHEDLERDFPVQLGIPRAVDLTHAPCTAGSKDLVASETVACFESHGLNLI